MNDSKVKVTFSYYPSDPDPSHPTGLSADEYEDLLDKLILKIGAEDVDIEKVDSEV